MNKILVMPIKNEDWILENTLKCASLWFDYIIVADQNSQDSTLEICKKFDKVIYIKNNETSYNEGSRRQLLLNRAREIDGENIIFALDADEIVSANIINNDNFEKILKEIKPGQSLKMEWVQLWQDTNNFNSAFPWGNSIGVFAYYDDRIKNFGEGRIHQSRVPEDTLRACILVPDIKILHFQFADFPRMMSKQAYYRIFEYTELNNKILKINFKYYPTKENPNLKNINPDWIKNYTNNSIDISEFRKDNIFWQDYYILEKIEKFGTKKFKWLDIWDINWEEKRKNIKKISNGKEESYQEFTIKDPRGFIIKFYHSWIQRKFSYKKIHDALIYNKLIYQAYKKIIK